METTNTIAEAVNFYHNVAKWSKPERAPWSFNFFTMTPTIRKEPKGVVLIISPFNYPMWLSLCPLVRSCLSISQAEIQRISIQAGAIAAGNACAVKPSELTPAFSALLADLLPKYLDPELYRVINGAVPETTKVRRRRLTWCKDANCLFCRFWNSSGIIVRDELPLTIECALILCKSSIHRRLSCRLYCA